MNKRLSLTWNPITQERQLRLWSLYLGSDFVPRWQQIPLPGGVLDVPFTGHASAEAYAESLGFTFVFMSMSEGLKHWEKLSDVELLSLPTYVDLRGRLSNA